MEAWNFTLLSSFYSHITNDDAWDAPSGNFTFTSFSSQQRKNGARNKKTMCCFLILRLDRSLSGMHSKCMFTCLFYDHFLLGSAKTEREREAENHVVFFSFQATTIVPRHAYLVHDHMPCLLWCMEAEQDHVTKSMTIISRGCIARKNAIFMLS